MPRIPAALAVVATLAICIGLNVAWYPAVWEMAAPGPAPGKTPGPETAALQPAVKAQDSAPIRAAYCTAEGVCYTADGKALPGNKKQTPKAPDLAKTAPSPVTNPKPPVGPVEAVPAAKLASVAVPVQAPVDPAEKGRGAQAEKPLAKPETADLLASPPVIPAKIADVERPLGMEKPLVPVVRPTEPVPTTGAPTAIVAVQNPAPVTPQPAIKKPVERLPPAGQMAAITPGAQEAALPSDSILIYPSTTAK